MLTLSLTPGEPAGIGPDLAVLLSRQSQPYSLAVIADPDLLRSRAQALGVDLEIQPWRGQAHRAGQLSVIDLRLKHDAHPGSLDPGNAGYVLAALEIAVAGCLQDRFQAMVTGPVQKSLINDAGFKFTGHTEFLATRAGAAQAVMMLVADKMRVALATTHLALADVPAAITRPRLMAVLQTLERDLREQFGLSQPRIAVCGLNPHAGEGGHLGREEIEVITPVIQSLREQGLDLRGPLPADTAFTPGNWGRVDAVLSMYHDQGLPVLKHYGFGRAVNVTLGLPFVRTSVDHGTALELAGSDEADSGSLMAALDLAASLAQKRSSQRAIAI